MTDRMSSDAWPHETIPSARGCAKRAVEERHGSNEKFIAPAMDKALGRPDGAAGFAQATTGADRGGGPAGARGLGGGPAVGRADADRAELCRRCADPQGRRSEEHKAAL